MGLQYGILTGISFAEIVHHLLYVVGMTQIKAVELCEIVQNEYGKCVHSVRIARIALI
jgi:hypothetical protein